MKSLDYALGPSLIAAGDELLISAGNDCRALVWRNARAADDEVAGGGGAAAEHDAAESTAREYRPLLALSLERKPNWIASGTWGASRALCVADVSPEITVYDLASAL